MLQKKDYIFLKKLEINGFKSFASKTVFEFPTVGITAIVGPNGSGKSNIIDALRYVLGERDAKDLRGGKSEDLIFAGSTQKAKTSLATVSLFFDNSSKFIPVDFEEVVISRKTTRNGISEYLINNSKVRLKDIIDIFSKMKMGSRGLSIIKQGSADLFVSSSNERRMMMIKESLGLKEYESKKHEAELKIKNTESRMEYILSTINEIAPRLKMLKRQSSKFERRKEIENNVSDIEMRYYASKISHLENQLNSIKAPLKSLNEELSITMKDLDDLKSKLAKLDANSDNNVLIAELSKKINILAIKKAENERELFKIEYKEDIKKIDKEYVPELKISKQFIESLKKKLSDILKCTEVKCFEDKIRQIIVYIDEVLVVDKKEDKDAQEKERIDYAKTAKEKILKTISEIDCEISSLDKKQREIMEKENSFRDSFKNVFLDVERKKDNANRIKDQIKEIRLKEDKLLYIREDITRRMEASNINEKELKNFISLNGSDGIKFSEDELTDMERKIIRLRNELAIIGEIDSSIVYEAKTVEERYNFLKKEYDDLLKSSDNLRELIKNLSVILYNKFNYSFNEINKAFNEYFRVMFEGGSAKMKMCKSLKSDKEVGINDNEGDAGVINSEVSDMENVHTGVDIEVKIPSKKITNLDALSGGEKSLVSIAALFAIISVSAPPFLVLDEIDAALDEKNSLRFSQLIKKFAENMQFLVVTHNRILMEKADILYGITMDSGVSKVLSLKME